MGFFLKLRHWELFLMLALPTVMSLVYFGLPLEPLIVAAIGLFIMLVLFAWRFSIAAWSNAKLPLRGGAACCLTALDSYCLSFTR